MVPMPDQHSYTLITCHFGDPFWIRNLLSSIQLTDESAIRSVVNVDQSRSSSDVLRALDPRVSVRSFAPNLSQVKALGHDHPHALNEARASLQPGTSHILVMDSDCFPIRRDWLRLLEPADVLLARDPAKFGLSHPCFMKFPTRESLKIDFSEGTLDVGIDTGRLVGLQLARQGLNVQFVEPSPAFGGRRGHFYLAAGVYHHGSASFISSSDPRLHGQVSQRWEGAYQAAIQRGRFRLPVWLRAWGFTRLVWRRLRT